MSRIVIPAAETATGATAEVYARIRKNTGGKVPNAYGALGHLAPRALAAILDAEEALAAGSLSRQERETVKLLVSAQVGCDYCEAAHTLMGKLAGLPPEALRAIRAGQPTGEAKRDALVRFVLALLNSRGTLAQGEVDAVRAAGYTDVQLADISFAVALITFTNVFNRINDTVVDFPPVA